MAGKRPTVVLVFGILNIVFGSLGLIVYLCSAVGGAFFLAIFTSLPGPGGGVPALPTPLIISMIVGVLYGLIMMTLLIIAGVGLLNMRPWARWLCVGFGVVVVLFSLGSVVFNVAYMQPAMDKWNEDMQRNMFRQPGNPTVVMTPSSHSSPLANATLGIFGAIIHMAYGVALLVVMFLPHVTAAFARPERGDDEDDPNGWEEEDSWDGRPPRRRDDGED